MTSEHDNYIRDLKQDYHAQWQLLLGMYQSSVDKDDLEEAELELERLENLLIEEGVTDVYP